MAEMNDFMQALDRFGAGVRSLQVNRSLNQANQKVQEVRASEANEAEQMQAIRGIANDLTLKLVGQGMDSGSIQTVNNAINPQPTAFQQNLYLQQMRDQSAGARAAGQQAFTAGENEKNRQNAVKVATAKGGGAKELGEKTLTTLTGIDTQLAQGESILKLIDQQFATPGLKNMGLLGKTWSRNDGQYAYVESKILNFVRAVRLATTGQSATDQELERIQEELPSLLNSPRQFKAKMKAILDDAKIARKVSLATQKKGGRDVSRFTVPGSAYEGPAIDAKSEWFGMEPKTPEPSTNDFFD